MKKILFVIPEYSQGGTNKSLENLLSLIDKNKYDIKIFCIYEDGGDYYKKVFAPYIIEKSRLYYILHDNVVTRKAMGIYNRITKRNNFSYLLNNYFPKIFILINKIKLLKIFNHIFWE